MSIEPYQLVRSNRRRTISLQVKNGSVRVLAPSYVSKADIDQFVKKKSKWLQDKLALSTKYEPVINKEFKHGECFYFLGKAHSLQVNIAVNNLGPKMLDKVECNEDCIVVTLAENSPSKLRRQQVQQRLIQWYVDQAALKLPKKVEILQNSIGLKAKELTIKFYKSRWGSCDSKQRMKLNWLLIMAPEFVIDYVIIHELCHLVHLNHSSAFWELVNTHTPHHHSASQWLKHHHLDLYSVVQ